MNFDEEMKNRVARVKNIIKRYLPEEEGFQKNLLEAINYSMLAGGKRIRPLLMQETYALFGGTGQIVEPFMAAMEMIHTHSLIHDDLPAMDNDEFRRGRKTTHVVYGEAMAILAGDGLLNLAYETAAKAFDMEPGNASIGKVLERDRLDFIYRLKTSALIEASMMIGAVLAGADEEQLAIIESVASDVGVAFQIQDDILDVTSTTRVLGKPVKSDEKNLKTTYVTIRGMEQAKEDVVRITGRALNNLNSLSKENDFLKELLLYLINREK